MAARAAEQKDPLRLSALPDRQGLATLLWESSPRLQPSRVRIAEARGELQRARLPPNPTLDFSWNTIPIGELNPPYLERPFANVPNYVFGLSNLIEIGKRGPRQGAAASAAAAAVEDARAILFDAFFDLSERIAAVAAAEVRIASLSDLAEDARKLTEIQKARAQKGDTAELDVDRSALEEEKLWAALSEERAKMASGLRECAEIAGTPCEPFGSSATAEAYLDQRPEPAVWLENRPDLRSLELQRAAAEHALTLARARAIPDPTFRCGYVLDRFLVSGNQGNSLFVGVSFPLTFFDHGQADARVAEAALSTAVRTRALLMEQAQSQLSKLTDQRGAVEERRKRIRETTLPLAESVVKRLAEVVRRGGAPLPELLLARRTLGELTADAADLDLSAFQLAIAEARLRGDGPPMPAGLLAAP
jgi:cobalt-zinc-cadmium efflux system outer membrane protein